jgi:hypothetical protein
VVIESESQPRWNPLTETCPLCTEGIKINTDFGHGREYLYNRDSVGPGILMG